MSFLIELFYSIFSFPLDTFELFLVLHLDKSLGSICQRVIVTDFVSKFIFSMFTHMTLGHQPRDFWCQIENN